MNKIVLVLILASMSLMQGYAQKTEVVTLGVFHFDFPNLDMEQTSEEDQIDVLLPVYQKEIELIVNKLAQFKPNAIVIEQPVYKQQKIDSLFSAYVAGIHTLSKSRSTTIRFSNSEDVQRKALLCRCLGNTDSLYRKTIGRR